VKSTVPGNIGINNFSMLRELATDVNSMKTDISFPARRISENYLHKFSKIVIVIEKLTKETNNL